MKNKSLYLAQSYEDAWADYQRSLTGLEIPAWDYVVLTASNEHQAEGFRAQLESRRGFLPTRTQFVVIPDEGGVRVGSGGATLSVLRYLRQREPGFEGKRIMVIHSGGDSKRVPQYSALGKLFSPVPHRLPDGRSSTLFDEFMIGLSAMPGRIQQGMLLLSGDVILLFNPLLVDYSGHGAAAISFKEAVSTGKDHGVFYCGEDGFVKRFLHKQTEATLREVGAVNESGAVDIDTGALIFGVDVLNALYSLISTDGAIDEAKYAAMVNDQVRLSLYGDFQFPLAADSTPEAFQREKPEYQYTPELAKARDKVWEALRPFRLKALRMAPASFIHFGTTREIAALMGHGVEQYRELGWSRRVNCSMDRVAGYNSVLSPKAEIGDGCYLEVSYVHSRAKVGEGSVLSYIDVHDEVIPPHVVMHGLKQSNGKFVCRIYGVEDNPKENSLLGVDLDGLGAQLWAEGESHCLWNANLYPECDTIQEAIAAALALYDAVINGHATDIKGGKSLAAGFEDADPEAVIAWNRRMSELVQMDHIARLIDAHAPVQEARLSAPLSKIQRQWVERRLSEEGYSFNMRLHYYMGVALGGSEGEKEIKKAFSTLSEAILEERKALVPERMDVHIGQDHHEVALPLRVNWGGGWSDTPPYCNENGGTVLNAAILLNNERPVRVKLDRLDALEIVIDSFDMDTHGVFTDIGQLQTVGDPYDPFVLQKAALLACGIIPAQGGDLRSVLSRLGGGIRLDTEVMGVPKGSGLGTSSILAAACVKALLEFMDIPYTASDIYSHVLSMEQIMSTGGGWQDQVGGVTDGIKYITSRPGLDQRLRVQTLKLDDQTMAQLNERFTLIYTGSEGWPGTC